MKIIADTNTFLAVALGEPERESIISATRDLDLFAPEILPYEIANALSRMVICKRLTPEDAATAFKLTQLIPVSFVAMNIEAALEISTTHKIYAYDAFFIQAAISENCPVITMDKQMNFILKKLNIEGVDLK